MSEYLSAHFTRREFQDPHTLELKLAPGFLDHLEDLRILWNQPMPVTDGCRSTEYNNWLLERGYPASKNSFHLIDNPKYPTNGCAAVDIKRPSIDQLAVLAGHALPRGWTLRLGRTFVHLDRRVDYTDLPSHLDFYRSSK